MMTQTSFLLTGPALTVITLLLLRITYVDGWFICPEEAGGGICPTHDFCCPSGIPGQSRCIPGNRNVTFIKYPGHCCKDDDGGGGGCGQNYTCADTSDTSDGTFPSCALIAHTMEGKMPPVLPRYPMCSFSAVTANVASTLYGLQIRTTITEKQDDDETSAAFMAYYSTHGDLLLQDQEQSQASFSLIHTVILSIHGSERNADDYLCGTYAAVPDPEHTLVIAPWFLAPGDLKEEEKEGQHHSYLQWIDFDPTLDHTWRYGADSMQHNISAFAVTDAFLDVIIAKIPNVKNIIVTGHSAGGQYTQRWALLSNHPLFLSGLNKEKEKILLRVVVANPKSYCYLDGRRWTAANENEDGGSWEIPSSKELHHCPMYNDWTWGFDHAVDDLLLPVPYKDHAIDVAGGLKKLIQRYPDRFVVYFQGFLDVLPNGDCPDLFQGGNRRERSRRYFEYLRRFCNNNSRTLHQYRVEAMKVHHDHSLMYASPEGQVALFGNTSDLIRMQGEQQQKQQKNPE